GAMGRWPALDFPPFPVVGRSGRLAGDMLRADGGSHTRQFEGFPLIVCVDAMRVMHGDGGYDNARARRPGRIGALFWARVSDAMPFGAALVLLTQPELLHRPVERADCVALLVAAVAFLVGVELVAPLRADVVAVGFGVIDEPHHVVRRRRGEIVAVLDGLLVGRRR